MLVIDSLLIRQFCYNNQLIIACNWIMNNNHVVLLCIQLYTIKCSIIIYIYYNLDAIRLFIRSFHDHKYIFILFYLFILLNKLCHLNIQYSMNSIIVLSAVLFHFHWKYFSYLFENGRGVSKTEDLERRSLE